MHRSAPTHNGDIGRYSQRPMVAQAGVACEADVGDRNRMYDLIVSSHAPIPHPSSGPSVRVAAAVDSVAPSCRVHRSLVLNFVAVSRHTSHFNRRLTYLRSAFGRVANHVCRRLPPETSLSLSAEPRHGVATPVAMALSHRHRYDADHRISGRCNARRRGEPDLRAWPRRRRSACIGGCRSDHAPGACARGRNTSARRAAARQ